MQTSVLRLALAVFFCFASHGLQAEITETLVVTAHRTPIVDPVLHGPSALYEYEPGTWGPKEADELTRAVGGWNTPE